MPEIPLPPPDIDTRVELAPPQTESLFDYEKKTEPVDPSLYFEGITKEDRDFGVEMLSIEARHWVEKIPGLEGRSNSIVGSLTGDLKDRDGVPYQSIKIANQINSGRVESIEKCLKDDQGFEIRTPISEEDFNELIRTAPNDGLAIYARMLRDLRYPQEYNDKTMLKPMPFDVARNVVINHHGKIKTSRGVFCGESEGRFMNSASKEGGLEEVKLGDEVIALRKNYGEDTAILIKEAVLNGVLLPKGTIVTVDYSEDGIPHFAFARLSAFVVDSPQQLEAMSPIISSNEYFKNNASGYDAIRALLGQDIGVSPADMEKSIQAIDSYLIEDTEAGEIAKILQAKMAFIRERQVDFGNHINDLYDEVDKKYPQDTAYLPDDGPEEKAAKNAYGDLRKKENAIVSALSASVSNPRVAYVEALDNLEKMFGKEKLLQVRNLLRDKEIANRVLANSK